MSVLLHQQLIWCHSVFVSYIPKDPWMSVHTCLIHQRCQDCVHLLQLVCSLCLTQCYCFLLIVIWYDHLSNSKDPCWCRLVPESRVAKIVMHQLIKGPIFTSVSVILSSCTLFLSTCRSVPVNASFTKINTERSKWGAVGV